MIFFFWVWYNRQHWFISRLDGASITAGGFPPQNNNILLVTTSSNQVYAFDVEAKQLGEWSMRHTFVLPRRYQEFPGEVIGLSFSPSFGSSSVVVYSPRYSSFFFFFLAYKWYFVLVGISGIFQFWITIPKECDEKSFNVSGGI